MAEKLFIRLAVLVAASVLCLVTATAGFGAPSGGGGGKGPKNRGTGTINLVLLESTDGLAHYGQRVTFNVSTTATTEPWVRLRCYQGGSLVVYGSEGFFERSLDDGVFGLGSPSWTGGAADCTADLTKPDGSVLGSTSFHVYA
jgi:hypothetical protein